MAWRWKISHHFLPFQSHDVQAYTNTSVCQSGEAARAASDNRISFFLGIFCLHHYKYQAPFMLSKRAPGSTAWVLATIPLQNITKSLLGWCFRAWYFLLGWDLIRVFLAFSCHSTPARILECLCLALSPPGILYLQIVDPASPWRACRLFCWQMCLYRTDLDEKKPLASSVLIQF